MNTENKLQCICGKTGQDVENCQMCPKGINQFDSFILGALKMQMMLAFFQQQYIYPNGNGGGQIYYGGQAAQLVEQIFKSDEFKTLLDELKDLLISRKDKWDEIVTGIMIPKIKNAAVSMADGYYLTDGMRSEMNKAAIAMAREIFENDAAFKEKIKAATNADKYTITFDIRVNIVEQRPQSS